MLLGLVLVVIVGIGTGFEGLENPDPDRVLQ